MRFPFPVGLILFNSPDYSERVLESLKNQTLVVEDNQLVVVIDGFRGSKPEDLGHEDFTDEIEILTYRYFPNSRILRSELNLGIAKQYEILSKEVFSQQNSTWGLFLEHDFVLNENYLEILEALIRKVENFSEIVQVDATGDTSLPLDFGEKNFYLPIHDWAFALRRSHYLERLNILSEYEKVISGAPYFKRDSQGIYKLLATFGVFPLGSMIDYVNQAIKVKFKNLSITTGEHYGTYIGAEGEDFTKEIYHEMGYQTWVTSNSDLSGYPEFTNETLMRLKSDQALSISKAANSIINFFESEYSRIVKLIREQSDNYENELKFLHNELALSHATNLKITKSRIWKVSRFISRFNHVINFLK
jgi:hypothetical protein